MFQVRSTPTFDADIKKLNKQIAKRVIVKIEELATKPQLLGNIIKYLPKDLANLQKYRIGDWRVLFWVNFRNREIILYGVEHRSKIYKRFKK